MDYTAAPFIRVLAAPVAPGFAPAAGAYPATASTTFAYRHAVPAAVAPPPPPPHAPSPPPPPAVPSRGLAIRCPNPRSPPTASGPFDGVDSPTARALAALPHRQPTGDEMDAIDGIARRATAALTIRPPSPRSSPGARAPLDSPTARALRAFSQRMPTPTEMDAIDGLGVAVAPAASLRHGRGIAPGMHSSGQHAAPTSTASSPSVDENRVPSASASLGKGLNPIAAAFQSSAMNAAASKQQQQQQQQQQQAPWPQHVQKTQLRADAEEFSGPATPPQSLHSAPGPETRPQATAVPLLRPHTALKIASNAPVLSAPAPGTKVQEIPPTTTSAPASAVPAQPPAPAQPAATVQLTADEAVDVLVKCAQALRHHISDAEGAARLAGSAALRQEVAALAQVLAARGLCAGARAAPTVDATQQTNRTALLTERECLICLEPLSDGLASVKCGHIFHHECCLKVAGKRKAWPCPKCSEEVRGVKKLFWGD